MSKNIGLIGVSVAIVTVAVVLALLVGTLKPQREKGKQPPAEAVTAETVPQGTPSRLAIAEYMPAERRERVERLKREVAEAASTPETAKARARVLFDWMNDFALQGGLIPSDMPQVLGAAGKPEPVPARVAAQIDAYVNELTLREESPEIFGELSSVSASPFAPGSMQTIRIAYTVGERAIEQGGGILVGKQIMSDQGLYQTSDPSGANYVTASASRADVKIAVAARDLGGMYGGFRGLAPQLFFAVEEGRLEPGDTLTVVIGDTSGGGPGFKVETHANDAFPIPLFLAFSADGQLYSLPLQRYVVDGGPVRAVAGFAPSVVAPGESFDISVRSEDAWRNRATGAIPAYALVDGGTEIAQTQAGEAAISIVSGVSFAEPGVHRIAIRSVDGGVVGAVNPILVEEKPARRVYWGETHAHSGFAEGQGSVDYFFTFGRDDARLDFLAMSEHDIFMDASEWETMRKAVEKYHDEGRFITYLAYEWTQETRFGGHHNVFFRRPEGRERVPVQTNPRLTDLYFGLRTANDERDVLVIPHAHQTGEYRINDPRVERLVEIMSLHGTFEWFGQAYLAKGHEVGFVAASDDHLSHPGLATMLATNLGNRSGLAAVRANEKSTDAIFDSLRGLDTYATTGERILLDVTLNGAEMGNRIAPSKERALAVRAVGTAPIESIAVVKNGKDVYRESYLDTQGGSETFEIAFWSSSDPVIRENARGWRRWRGTLTATGARLDGVSAPGLRNIYVERVEPVADDPQSVRFVVLTRGDTKSLYVTLAEATPEAAIALQIEPDTESGTPLIVTRPHTAPALDMRFALADVAAAGRLVQTSPGAVTDDLVSLRRIALDVPMERTISWTEEAPTSSEDYYYVRVRQVDGSMAWSSPIWVGGFSRFDQ